MDNIGDELSTFTEAMSFEQTGDYNAAAEIYQHLVTLERIKDNSDYSILVDYLNRAGYCFQKSNDVTKSQQCFREAQDLRQNIIIEKEISANLDYNPNLYESLSDFDKDFIGKTELELIDLVAKLQGKAKRFEESKKPNLAAAHYAKLLELAKRVRSISNDDLIKYAEKAAFNLQNAKCFRQALYYYTEAVRLNIKEKKYNSIAMNYNNMSFLYLQYQNYSAALKYCQQSLKFNKKINNTYQISLNLSNLGQIYRKQKNYEKALSSFEQAVALKIKLGKRKDIAHEVYHIAEVYRDQGQYKDAIAKINTALSIVNDVETRKIALYNDLLGELYTKQNQPETALQYFTKALSTYTVHSKWKASEVLSKICAIYREQQDFANLVTYLEKNLHINTEINDENKIEVLLREIAHVLYEQKEYEQAKEYFSKIIVSHEQKGRAKSFSAYYQDLHTLAAWHKQLQQYSESFNLLQKALNTAKKTNYGSVEVTLHCIGNVYLVQQESERALRAYEQAVEESNDWYKNVLHLVAIAATHAQKNDIEVANEYYQKAQEKILQNRKTDDILYLETLKDEEQRFLEFKSYYLQAYIYAKVAKLSSDDAIKFHLQAINLFKDLCAVDSKNIYEDNCEKQDIDIEINKQQCLVEQINYLTSTCAELIEQQQQDVVLEAIELLFDSNESIYGIEYCEDLLKLCSEIISARQLTNYFFQMGLRYFQLQEYSKSLVSYAKSVGVSQDFHDEKTQNALKKILSILRKQQILFDDEVASTLGKCIEVAENSDLFAQLLKSLCLLYKESATPERGAHYFTIALEELSESDRQFVIDFLRTLTDRYTALGERDKVLQVQEDLLRLEHGVKQTDFLEEIDCEKTQRMAHTFLSLNEYDKALENFVLLEKEYRKQSQKQYLAQTLLNIGRIHGYMANVKNALESLHEALTISREINDRELIGEVLQSINNVYVQNQDIEGALHYNLSMLDLDRRYGFKPFIILDLYHISKLYINKRDFAAAISYAEEALQIIHDHKQSTIVDTTEVLILLEDLYTHTENSAKLIDVYMQLIALHKKAREEDMILTYKDLLLRACEKYYAKVQNMTSVEKSLENQESLFNAFIYLARAKSKQGLVESSSYEKSVASLREACQIYQNLKNYVSPRNKHIVYDEMVQCQEGLSQSLLALGDYHMNFETYADAVFFYAENIEVRKEMNDPQSLVDSCLRLANAYQKQRQLQESLEALLQALKYCQESGIEQEEMRLYNKISQLYLTLGEQEKAFEYSEKVVNFYRQISQTAPLHVNEDLLSEAKNVTATIKENTKKQGRDFTLSIEGQLPKSDRSQQMDRETFLQTTTYNKRLAQTLKNQGVVNEQMLNNFLAKCNQTGINLGQALVQQKVISAHNLVEVIRAMNTNATVANQKQVITTKTFGKYNIIKELGRGGMGVVYLVEQPDVKRTLVLKTLLPVVGSDIVQVKRFYKEAETVSTLHHPNIIPIYEFGQENNMPYFTMQYIDGIDFQQLIDQGNMDFDVCLQILEKICRALHYAHEKGIVHRDIKPANIMLDKNFEPYLADFGLAKRQNKKSSLTQTGAVIGTPFYLSPEQVKGSRKAIDHRTDIYSMGIILYKVLSGEFPFTAGELPSLYRKILRDLPTPPKKIKPSIPSNLNYICLKAIAKNSDDRYQTAHAFAEALKNFRTKKSINNEERFKISWRYWWAQYRKLVSYIAIVSISIFIAFSVWVYNSNSYHSLFKKHQQVYYDVVDSIQQNQYEAAIARVKPFSNKKSPFILAAKAQIQYEWLNNQKMAQKFFMQALELAENNTEIIYAYSRFLFATKQYAKVLAHINKAIDLSKENSEYYRLRAEVYQKLHKNSFATKDIATATKIENANIKQGLEKLNEYKQQQNWTGALVVLNEIIGRYPHCEIAYRERAQVYKIREQMTLAVNDITRAISLNPSLENYALQAQWLFDLGQEENALRSYEYLLEKQPQVDVYQKVLYLQVETGKFKDAVNLYNSMPENFKNNENKLSIAKAYFLQQNYTAVLKVLPSSQSSLVSYYHGISLFHLQKYQQASVILRKLLKSPPQDLSSQQQADVFYFSAKILYNRKKFSTAQKYLLKAIKIQRLRTDVNFLLAEVYQQLQDHAQSLKYYSICIELQPWKVAFYKQRGLVYRKLEQWSRANYDFLKCIELKSTDIDLISHIYECAYAEKDPFKKFTMQITLKGRLLNIYNRLNLGLFEEQKNKLASMLLNATLPKPQKFDATKLKLAESFLQTIIKNSSGDIMEIASNGLQGLYGLTEVQQLVLEYSQNERFGKKTRFYLQQVYEKLREKYLADKEIDIKQKIARYFIAQDQGALLEIYQNRDYAVDVLRYILYNEEKDIMVRFYTAETLALLKLRECVQILQEGRDSSKVSVAIICKVVLAKLELAANPSIEYQDLKNMPAFLIVKCIEYASLNEGVLHKLLTSNFDIRVILHAAQKLWSMGDKTPLPILLEHIQSSQKQIQKFALNVFWSIKGYSEPLQRQIVNKYLSQLFAFSDHKDPGLRKLAVAKMANISSDKIIDKVREKLDDKSKDVRAQAISTLAKRGDIMKILKITENSQEEIAMRLAPFSYFETAQNATNIPIFEMLAFATKLLKDPDPRIRFIIITYLMRANSGKSAPYTISQVNLKDDDDRFAAALGMAQSGIRMMPYLQKFIEKDDNEYVRMAAAASAINILAIEKKPQIKKLEELHQKINTYSSRIKAGASFGYSYYLYQYYYITSALNSSLFHEINNEYYDKYLHNLEVQVPTAKPSKRDMVLLCAQKATELNPSSRCALERAVVEYACERFDASRRTLLTIKDMDDNPSYLYWKAKIHLHFGELKQAQQMIIQAQKDRPWIKRYVFLHSRIEEALGNQKKHNELIDRATLLNQDFYGRANNTDF